VKGCGATPAPFMNAERIARCGERRWSHCWILPRPELGQWSVIEIFRQLAQSGGSAFLSLGLWRVRAIQCHAAQTNIGSMHNALISALMDIAANGLHLR